MQNIRKHYLDRAPHAELTPELSSEVRLGNRGSVGTLGSI